MAQTTSPHIIALDEPELLGRSHRHSSYIGLALPATMVCVAGLVFVFSHLTMHTSDVTELPVASISVSKSMLSKNGAQSRTPTVPIRDLPPSAPRKSYTLRSLPTYHIANSVSLEDTSLPPSVFSLVGIAASFMGFGALLGFLWQRNAIAMYSTAGQSAEPAPESDPAAKPSPPPRQPRNPSAPGSFSNIFQNRPPPADFGTNRSFRSTGGFTDVGPMPSYGGQRSPPTIIDIGGGGNNIGGVETENLPNPFNRPFARPMGPGMGKGMGLGMGKGKGKGGFGKGFGKGMMTDLLDRYTDDEQQEEDEGAQKIPRRRTASQDPNAPPMNDAIKAKELRVIRGVPGGKDEKLGVLSREEALRIAEEEDVDLVIVNAESSPPVAKLVNYSKLKYESEKKKKENLKKGKVKEVKELKMSHKIGQHDYSVRLKAAKKFLTAGHRVKVTMEFKGRENQFVDIGKGVLKKFQEDLVDCGKAEAIPRKLGTKLILSLAPGGEALKALESARLKKKTQKDADAALSEDTEEEEDDFEEEEDEGEADDMLDDDEDEEEDDSSKA